MIFKKNVSLYLLASLLCYINPSMLVAKTNSIVHNNSNEPYQSYLKPNEITNSLTLLPPPPQQDSPAFSADKEAYKQGYALKNTARWAVAQSDANLADSNIGKPFSQALGITISKKKYS